MPNNADSQYLALILKKIEVCKAYRPKFGQKKPSTLAEFSTLYGGDMFYNWIGLNNPLLYAAHKAAGGLTSLYRQIGIGCEGVVKQVLRDRLGLNHAQTTWSYSKVIPGRKKAERPYAGRENSNRRGRRRGREKESRRMDEPGRNTSVRGTRGCANS